MEGVAVARGLSGPQGANGPIGKSMIKSTLSSNDSPDNILNFDNTGSTAVYYNASSIGNNLTP